MRLDTDDLENEDERSVAELLGVPRVPHKLTKPHRAMIADMIDCAIRKNASKIAEVQDGTRRPVENNRYDVNSYAGGPTTIPDLCVVKKRKVR